jgi:PAS domain S-box-containing protein
MPLRLRFPKHLGAVAGIALAGLLAGWAGYSMTRDRLRRDTTRAAARYAVSFAAAELQALTGTRADVDGAAYAMVRARLERLVELDPQVRTIRLIRDRVDENRIVLLAIATRPEIGNASLPGEDYAALQTSPAFQAALRTGEPAAEGPFPAAAGAWLRGYAAVFHPEDGAARAPVRDFLVLGLRPRRAFGPWFMAGAAAAGVWLLLGAPWGVYLTLRRQREQGEVIRNLSEAMEQADSALMIVDLRGCIEYVNAGLCRQIGYSRRELVGRPWREFQQPAAPTAMLAEMAARVRAGGSWTGEWSNRRKNGEVYPLRGAVAPVLRRAGQLAGFVAVLTDLTEVKQTETVLREAKERAEAGDRAKGQFLATMSHEVRTPLNGIVGFTGLLRDTPLNAEQQEYVETIRASSEALIQMTGEILDYARIESGRLKLEPQLCNPADCVEEALDLLASKAAEKNIELLHWIDDSVPAVVLVDDGRLRQMLVNLVNNAVKFTVAGEIEVRVRAFDVRPEPVAPASATARVEAVPTAAQSCALEFTVRDTGIGIAPEHHGKLFKPFSQVDDSTTRRFGGTGLGLAICKNIVGLMGGRIGFVSEQGRGSTFTISFRVPLIEPASRPAPAAGGPLRLAVAAVPGGLRSELVRLGRRLGAQVIETEPAALAGVSGWDSALLDVDETLAAALAAQPTARPGLPPEKIFGLVPLSLTSAHRAALRRHFRLLINKPVHHEALRLLLSGPAAPVAATERRTPTFALSVLIVEDNLVNQRLAEKVLTSLGCRWTTAPNGLAALEELKHLAPDVVLMDLHMPEMDGLTATTLIRAGVIGAERRNVWIVALTADARAEQRTRALAAGANDYLTKPVHVSDLTAALERYLAARRG